MVIEDNKYDALLAFVESGSQGDLSEEMVKYVEILDTIRGMYSRYKSRMAIINFLQISPFKLSRLLAVRYYSDAVNFFYLDNQISKQAWRNMYAEKLDRAADLVLKTANCSKDIDIYKNIIYAAREMRQLNEPDKEDIPVELFKKPNKVYILNPELVGRKKPDRNLLAQHIDSLDIPETEKQRIKSDAMIEDIEFLTED